MSEGNEYKNFKILCNEQELGSLPDPLHRERQAHDNREKLFHNIISGRHVFSLAFSVSAFTFHIL